MKIQRFEEIIAWQKAQDLAVDVYHAFSESKDFGFKDQIQKASVSISNNIAEGFDRFSDREFVRFLYIALASCSEVKSMLYLAVRLRKIAPTLQETLLVQANEISKIIRGLIMQKPILLLFVLLAPGLLGAQESRIENFLVMENLLRNDKLAIIATDTADVPNEAISGTYQFVINGFRQELTFHEGVAVTPQAIDKSTFVFVKHQNQTGSVGKLYFLYKSEQGFRPILINWLYLVLIPALVLLIGYMFRRLLVWAVIAVIAMFIFNYQKGLDVTNIFETIVHGIKDFMG